MRAMIKVLRLLRKEANLSQKELADRLAVSRDLIARLENNIQKITDDILEKYSSYFQVEISKLYKLAETYQKNFEYIFRAQHTDEFSPELRNRFEEWYDRMQFYTIQVPILPILPMPDDLVIKDMTDPAEVADLLRREWNLGYSPIHDPVALAESLGFFITGADLGTEKLFAISGRRGKQSQPGIMVNTREGIPIERQRFSIIHEIGHIILHAEYFTTNPDYSGSGRSKEDFEKESDAFAGALQVPEAEFKRMYRLLKETSGTDLAIIILVLKRHFKVSYQTIIYRLYDLHLINDNLRNRLFAFFKSRFQNQEPLPISEPLIFSQETKIKDLFDKRNLTEVPAEA